MAAILQIQYDQHPDDIDTAHVVLCRMTLSEFQALMDRVSGTEDSLSEMADLVDHIDVLRDGLVVARYETLADVDYVTALDILIKLADFLGNPDGISRGLKSSATVQGTGSR